MKKILSILLAALLGLSLATAASAKTVTPNPAGFSVEWPADRCVLTDIRPLGNGQVELTLYETETFPAAKIEALKAGDEVVTDGATCKVNTVKRDEFGDFIINEGTADELRLWKMGPDAYAVTVEDDAHPQVVIGKKTVELNEFMTLVDFIDAETGDILDAPVIRTGKDMLAIMDQADLVHFDHANTYVIFSGSAPWIVIRTYAPWQ